MIWIVAYDLSDDGARSRVAKLLERAGVRVQRSVFECRLEDGRKVRLQRALGRVVRLAPGESIRFYRLCGACMLTAEVLGPAPDSPPALGD